MKNAKKVLLLVLCAVLLVGASVMGTLAYLTSQSSVTNTFTVGKVELGEKDPETGAIIQHGLDEAKVNEYGKPVDATGNEVQLAAAPRVTGNEYKLVPGHTYTKDPTIHVGADSEECWLFVKIENGLGENATINFAKNTKWEPITGTDYWKYTEKVGADKDIVVFESFTYEKDVTNTKDDAAERIIVTAYAIQADGLTTVDEAWDALDLV